MKRKGNKNSVNTVKSLRYDELGYGSYCTNNRGIGLWSYVKTPDPTEVTEHIPGRLSNGVMFKKKER